MTEYSECNGSGIRNDKQPNIRHAFGGPLYRWSFASVAGFPDQEARWLYEIQPEVEKFNLKLNKKKAASFKLQAPSLTVTEGYYRIIKKEKYGQRNKRQINQPVN